MHKKEVLPVARPGQKVDILLCKKKTLALRSNLKPDFKNVPAGNKIFSYNTSTGEIKVALKPKAEAVDFNLIYKQPNCIYYHAKNHEEAKTSFETFIKQEEEKNEKEKIKAESAPQ